MYDYDDALDTSYRLRVNHEETKPSAAADQGRLALVVPHVLPVSGTDAADSLVPDTPLECLFLKSMVYSGRLSLMELTLSFKSASIPLSPLRAFNRCSPFAALPLVELTPDTALETPETPEMAGALLWHHRARWR